MKNSTKPMRQTLLAAAVAALVLIAGCAAAERTPGEPIVTDIATIHTTMGNITVELYGKDAPKTVANFVGLAKKDFYDGILFHRVVPGFVIQAGDPLTKDISKKELWGNGGESIYGGQFEDELDTAAPSYKRGYVKGALAMANAGPNTNTSQFFIMIEKSERLKKQFTIFGKVIAGMNVVESIGRLEIEPSDDPTRSVPKVPPMITGIDVEKE